MKKSNFILPIGTLLLFVIVFNNSCGSYDLPIIKATYNGDVAILSLDLIFKMDVYDKLESILKMFNYATVTINITILDDKILLANKKVERKIRYDRWDDYFIVEDSFNNYIKKEKEFISIVDKLYTFSNITFNIVTEKSKKYTLMYDFYLDSTELIPPFVLIKYNKAFANIKIKNKKSSFYVN